MSDQDQLTRFMFEHAAVRGEMVSLDDSWQEVLRRSAYPQAVQDLLGELTAAAALLMASLKFAGSLVLQMQSDTAIRLLVVEVTSDHTLRATAKWLGEVTGVDMGQMMQSGQLVLTLDPREQGQQAWQGIVPLQGESVAQALMHYMRQSEQIDTHLVLASSNQRAAGLLLQRLPDQPQGDPDAWNRAVHLASTLTAAELLSLTSRQVLDRLFHQETIRLFDAEPVSFHCDCSRERVANMLRMLGQEEIASVLSERDNVEVTCEFCGKTYHFDAVDSAQLWLDGPQIVTGDATRH